MAGDRSPQQAGTCSLVTTQCLQPGKWNTARSVQQSVTLRYRAYINIPVQQSKAN